MKDALATMAQIVGDTDNIVGGTSGALETDFPTSVTNAFKDNPDGAKVIEGDFVESVITDSTPPEPETGFNVFDFPSIDGSAASVVGGGDTIIMFNDSPAAPGADRVPRDARGGGDLGEARRLLEREQERGRHRVRGPAAARRPRPRSAMRRRSASTSPTSSRRRSARRWGRVSGRSSRTSCSNPDDVDGTAEAMEPPAARAF